MTGDPYRDLLAKYDKPGPRYTSYPTAPAWSEDFTAVNYAERLQAAGQNDGEPLSLYVHIPYCDALCFFCGCATVITQRHEKEEPYVDRVLAEALTARNAMTAAAGTILYYGSRMTPRQFFIINDDIFLGSNWPFRVIPL